MKVRVVFRSGVPSAPLPHDPQPIVVDAPEDFTPRKAASILYGPIKEEMLRVYGHGGWNGLGPLEGMEFWAHPHRGRWVGAISLRCRVPLYFYYEEV